MDDSRCSCATRGTAVGTTSTTSSSRLLVRNGYPAPRDIRGTGSESLAGRSDLAGNLSGVGARRHYARDLPGSRASSPLLSVLQFRRPFQVRLSREARLVLLGDMSVCGVEIVT